MALTMGEMARFAQASSGQFRYGLGKKKSCCESCARGGPCTGCGPGRPCTCKGGLGGTTTVFGQADLDPGDYGYQFVSTTKPGTTVFGRRQGFVDPGRRIALTRQIEELEFLAGSPGVHPRALASKVWQARRALMGIGDWAWASYADPRSRYDSKEDLEARLAAVERVLGVGQLSPRLMAAYGSGAFSGLGQGTWGQPYNDPVTKLASCIRGMLCAPKDFCCPPGTCYQEPYYEEEFWEDEFWDDEPLDEFPSPPPPPNGTWVAAPPTPFYVQPQAPQIAVAAPPPQIAVAAPGAAVAVQTPQVALAPAPQTAVTVTTPQTYSQLVSTLPQATAPKAAYMVAPGVPTPKALVGGAGIPVGQQRGALVVGGGPVSTGAAILAGLSGAPLNNSPAINALRAQLRQTRRAVRRRRA